MCLHARYVPYAHKRNANCGEEGNKTVAMVTELHKQKNVFLSRREDKKYGIQTLRCHIEIDTYKANAKIFVLLRLKASLKMCVYILFVKLYLTVSFTLTMG